MRRRGRPAKTPKEKQDYMVTIAEDRAEQQILDGTVSAQVLTHYLKMGSIREEKELRRLEADIKLTEVKAEREASAKDTEALIGEALAAMRQYTGHVEEYESDQDVY